MRDTRALLTVAVSVLAACTGNAGDTRSENGTGATTQDGGAPPAEAGPGPGPVTPGTTTAVELQILSLVAWNGALEETKSGTSRYGGLPTLSAYFKEARAEVPYTLVAAGADSFGVTPTISSYFGDQPTVEA